MEDDNSISPGVQVTIPAFVFGAAIWFIVALFALLTLADLYYHHASFNDFLSNWFAHFLIVFGLIVVSFAMRLIVPWSLGLFHTTITQKHERAMIAQRVQKLMLQNSQLKAQTIVLQEAPALIKYAIREGHNIDMSPQGDIKIASWKSNIRRVDEPEPQRLVESPREIARPTIAELIQAVERNSYKIPLGRSLTTGHILTVDLEDSHIRSIGASRMGKSCEAAAIIAVSTQTHDNQHLQIALLDLENKTSQLFQDSGHILHLQGGTRRLYATTVGQVAYSLIVLHEHMSERYQLTDEELQRMPRILIYLEEFLYWKKLLANFVTPSIAEQALASFSGLATRGLKVRMHLMICAQVDYADSQLKDAMAQFIGANLSFAVKPTAALAAGFTQTSLLNQNYRDKKQGQFVLESIGASDLGIAPQYDISQLLHGISSMPNLPLAHELRQTGPLDLKHSFKPSLQDDDELQRALEAYHNGARGPRALERALGIPYHKARKLWDQLQGLID